LNFGVLVEHGGNGGNGVEIGFTTYIVRSFSLDYPGALPAPIEISGELRLPALGTLVPKVTYVLTY